MSTVEDSGLAASEHKPEPTIDAGCEIEVSRSVSWTAHSAGFAELKRRASAEQFEALRRIAYWRKHQAEDLHSLGAVIANSRWHAFNELLAWLDELSACEGCKHAGVMDNDFNGPSS
jgi:hypothetical protein